MQDAASPGAFTADAYSQGPSETVVGQALADLGLDESRMLVAMSFSVMPGDFRRTSANAPAKHRYDA
ncbi:hypothetical protein GNZ13_15815 [Paraburkholderia sp. 5N]|uniref:Uncharacterized protein n=1 Tax=Paraburkholderia elongata TaxID=2675747 RepID=A0A972SII4_9BURK|nr:hypothetical protein [Paraburkholderia elongata]